MAENIPKADLRELVIEAVQNTIVVLFSLKHAYDLWKIRQRVTASHMRLIDYEISRAVSTALESSLPDLLGVDGDDGIDESKVEYEEKDSEVVRERIIDSIVISEGFQLNALKSTVVYVSLLLAHRIALKSILEGSAQLLFLTLALGISQVNNDLLVDSFERTLTPFVLKGESSFQVLLKLALKRVFTLLIEISKRVILLSSEYLNTEETNDLQSLTKDLSLEAEKTSRRVQLREFHELAQREQKVKFQKRLARLSSIF